MHTRTKEGKLNKIGGIIVNGWQERYFCIENGEWKWWANKEELETGKPPHFALELTKLSIRPNQTESCFDMEGPNEKDKSKTKIHNYKALNKEERDSWITALVAAGASPPAYEFFRVGMDHANLRYRLRFNTLVTDYLFIESDIFYLVPAPKDQTPTSTTWFGKPKAKEDVGLAGKLYITNQRVSCFSNYLLKGMESEVQFNLALTEIKAIQRLYRKPSSVKIKPPENVPYDFQFTTEASVNPPNLLQILENGGRVHIIYGLAPLDFDICFTMISQGIQYQSSPNPWAISHLVSNDVHQTVSTLSHTQWHQPQLSYTPTASNVSVVPVQYGIPPPVIPQQQWYGGQNTSQTVLQYPASQPVYQFPPSQQVYGGTYAPPQVGQHQLNIPQHLSQQYSQHPYSPPSQQVYNSPPQQVYAPPSQQVCNSPPQQIAIPDVNQQQLYSTPLYPNLSPPSYNFTEPSAPPPED